MTHLFIINPVSGKGKGTEKTKKKINDVLSKIKPELAPDDEIITYVTTAPMDASERVKAEALTGRPLRVYACGGDGTLNECIHGAAGFSNAAVTHYPCGTGNDFIKIFGDDAAKFNDLELLITGETWPVDLIDVNGRKCLNIASVGIDARIGIDVHKYSGLPLLGASSAYVVSLIVNFLKGINQKLNIKTEYGEESGKYALVCICNGRFYGGGFNPIKTSLPDDGILDMLIVKKVSMFKAYALLNKYSHGEYYKMPDIITHVRGRYIEIEADKTFPVNIDGEVIYTKDAVMRIIEHGANIFLPKGLDPSALRINN